MSLNPTWSTKQNSFTAELPDDGGCVVVEVWDHDMGGIGNSFKGEVSLNLWEVDLPFETADMFLRLVGDCDE